MEFVCYENNWIIIVDFVYGRNSVCSESNNYKRVCKAWTNSNRESL